jgi:uncharacterized protein (DUF427 family)
MAKAIWENAVLAESDKTVVVEGNQYFPPDSVNHQYLKPTNTVTTCPWKGKAAYFTIEANGKRNIDAAWYYSNPLKAAENIKDHVAFWRGVTIEA